MGGPKKTPTKILIMRTPKWAPFCGDAHICYCFWDLVHLIRATEVCNYVQEVPHVQVPSTRSARRSPTKASRLSERPLRGRVHVNGYGMSMMRFVVKLDLSSVVCRLFEYV